MTSAVVDASPWSDNSARTMPAGRLELGTLSPSRWALDDRLEIGAHPIWFFALPHIEAKAKWWQDTDLPAEERPAAPGGEVVDEPSLWRGRTPRYVVATKHRLSVPTPFLALVSGEGAGALLPDDTEVPFAVELQSDLLASYMVAAQAFTVRVGLVVAAREQSQLPLLDFPFLYPRFASLYAPFVPRAGLGASGTIVAGVGYEVDLLASYLPIDEQYFISSAWDFEAAARLYLRQGRHSLSAGALVDYAEYPIGWRLYWIPTLDYRFALLE